MILFSQQPRLKTEEKMDGDMLYFHGKVSRTDAESLLMASYAEGNFLVRASSNSPGDYVLSLCVSSQVLHFQIKQQGEVKDRVYSERHGMID
jgi:hypothetical protein